MLKRKPQLPKPGKPSGDSGIPSERTSSVDAHRESETCQVDKPNAEIENGDGVEPPGQDFNYEREESQSTAPADVIISKAILGNLGLQTKPACPDEPEQQPPHQVGKGNSEKAILDAGTSCPAVPMPDTPVQNPKLPAESQEVIDDIIATALPQAGFPATEPRTPSSPSFHACRGAEASQPETRGPPSWSSAGTAPAPINLLPRRDDDAPSSAGLVGHVHAPRTSARLRAGYKGRGGDDFPPSAGNQRTVDSATEYLVRERSNLTLPEASLDLEGMQGAETSWADAPSPAQSQSPAKAPSQGEDSRQGVSQWRLRGMMFGLAAPPDTPSSVKKVPSSAVMQGSRVQVRLDGKLQNQQISSAVGREELTANPYIKALRTQREELRKSMELAVVHSAASRLATQRDDSLAMLKINEVEYDSDSRTFCLPEPCRTEPCMESQGGEVEERFMEDLYHCYPEDGRQCNYSEINGTRRELRDNTLDMAPSSGNEGHEFTQPLLNQPATMVGECKRLTFFNV